MIDQTVLLGQCRDKAFYAFGTSKIFERRMRRLELSRNWITYLGIVVPLLVGSLALSFGKEWVVFLAVPAGIVIAIQLALSVWSLVAKWDDKYSYSINAMQAQTKLFNAWDQLGKRRPEDLEKLVDELNVDDQRQEALDLAQSISEKEKRYAMRYSLFHFAQACRSCKTKPASMKPTNCDTCGNF